ncbi:MAG: L-threonine 3-dehydrogenase [Candidatus Acetothermia bacterium]|nr:L-threonine 3-dehydrogenase [Candidatus Acetothermia bacterium]MDH7505606.1 L-threonine 3-dehydrogenase [Candidatus Acetothermia bacterium]
MGRIIVTGACGQIGTELVPELRRRYGQENVLATDIRGPTEPLAGSGPFALVDVTDRAGLARLIERHKIDTVYHLAAILSARGEREPERAWEVNVEGLRKILELAREHGLRLFWPSSIAIFGPATPKENVPQETVLCPTTIYGITKVAGELLCDYYFHRFGFDVRGLRYPGIISSEAPPGGGTTDYAVEIFHAAVREGRYTCFLREDTVLPMMFMPDAIRAAIELMEAPLARLKHHANFNVAAMSFSPAELAAEIRRHIPEFVCDFEPDARQAIADSWPRTIDDTAAREEWGWRPRYDLKSMVAAMLTRLSERYARSSAAQEHQQPRGS